MVHANRRPYEPVVDPNKDWHIVDEADLHVVDNQPVPGPAELPHAPKKPNKRSVPPGPKDIPSDTHPAPGPPSFNGNIKKLAKATAEETKTVAKAVKSLDN